MTAQLAIAENEKQSAETPKDETNMSEANRSSNVGLDVYEQILTGPKCSEAERSDFWDGVLALYRAEDSAKKAKEN